MIVAIATVLFAGSAIGEGMGERHMHSFAKDVDAFHAALAPLWHAPAGKERAQNVCAQAPRLESLAREVHSGDAKPLLSSITALQAQCRTNPADIDAAFSQVHEAFHHLAMPNRH
ncbi:MAG: hypothetical protein A2Z95_07260 [Gallionellales bacterium GWA2_60_18]|nr:MAG: hypothetical protein A2Z95_07260 [Gallionellales bacterium GWA2_60_18]